MSVTAVLITRDPSYPKDISFNFPFDEVLVETSCPNVKRRFDLALQAKNDVIYVQDDDAEIDVALLAKFYDGRLTNAITPGHQRIYAGTGVTLIGWGCFFPKALIDFTRWTERYGNVDEMEIDRIFTYLAQPHNNVVMPVKQFRRPVRMSDRPGHYAAKDRILKMLKELSS